MSKFWNEVTNRLSPYVPGEQTEAPGLIKLNTNENPYGPSPKVIQAISEAVGEDLRLYPDPQGLSLRAAIAETVGLEKDNIFIGNGSDEVLAHTFRALFQTDKRILFPDVTYSFYPTYCKLFGLDFEQIKLNNEFEIQIEDYDRECGGIIFPNPNAPTGIDIGLGAIENLVKLKKDTIIVIDEAYIEFGAETCAQLVRDHCNLLVTRSLSKSHSLAGLRVGYAIGDKELIDGLYRVKDSFNSYPIDRLALRGAEEAVKDEVYLNQTNRRICVSREKLFHELKGLGFYVLPSKANFVFIKHESFDGEELARKLRERNIIVRHFSKPNRIQDFIRVTVGTDASVDALVSVLRVITSE